MEKVRFSKEISRQAFAKDLPWDPWILNIFSCLPNFLDLQHFYLLSMMNFDLWKAAVTLKCLFLCFPPPRDLLRIGVTLAGHQKKILNSIHSMRVQMSQSPTAMAWELSFSGRRRGRERTKLKGEPEVEHCGMFWRDWLLHWEMCHTCEEETGPAPHSQPSFLSDRSMFMMPWETK